MSSVLILLRSKGQIRKAEKLLCPFGDLNSLVFSQSEKDTVEGKQKEWTIVLLFGKENPLFSNLFSSLLAE